MRPVPAILLAVVFGSIVYAYDSGSLEKFEPQRIASNVGSMAQVILSVYVVNPDVPAAPPPAPPSTPSGGGGGGGAPSSSPAPTQQPTTKPVLPQNPSDKNQAPDSQPIASTLPPPTTASTPPNAASAPASIPAFTKPLSKGSTGGDVKNLQRFLNTHGFPITTSGIGSLGQETGTFGPRMQSALIKFQTLYAKEIGITAPTGTLGPKTRAFINIMLSGEAKAKPSPARANAKAPSAPTATQNVMSAMSNGLKALFGF